MPDPNLKIIKNKILEIAPEAKIILFGSRATGTNRVDSDYDLLVQVEGEMDVRQKRKIAISMRKALSDYEIPLDIIVQTKKDFEYRLKDNHYFVSEVNNSGVIIE